MNDDIVLKACLTLNPEQRGKEAVVEAELRAACNNELSEYMRPYYYEFREELPLTSAGKIDYRALENNQ